FDPSRFWIFALVSILLLPVQSATEEIVVRGYMNKGLIHWFGNKWVAFVITSGAFMALHLSNPEALAAASEGNLPIVMSGYFFFGMAACLMVLIDDGLESAIGVHAGNNTFAAIFVNYENSALPTPSIWQSTPDPTRDSITIIVILCVVLAILYATRKPRPVMAAQ
ncbi:MAG: CPBP family intramembrane glutamic endopeptidase, partial [Pseudomonadota bacterium]